MEAPKYTQKKSLARFRKVVIQYCQDAAEAEDSDMSQMTLQERIEDFLLATKIQEIN